MTFIPMLSRNPPPRFTIKDGDTTAIGVESIDIRRRDALRLIDQFACFPVQHAVYNTVPLIYLIR